MTTVTPETLRGFQDLLPADMIARTTVIDDIRRVFESYGFVPLDSPVLESLPVLVGTGGEETNKLIFELESPEGQKIGMRFDLTVPFARLLAQYPEELKLPFRRYHVGPVFRADDPSPSSGRFRQFTQFDIDAAGSDSPAVDAEIVAAMRDALAALGLIGGQDFIIRVNSRRLVDALLHKLGVTDPEIHKHVLRVVDKLEKVGTDEVLAELTVGRTDSSGDEIRGVGLSAEQAQGVLDFVTAPTTTRAETLDYLRGELEDAEGGKEALEEMTILADALNGLGVSEDEAVILSSLTRGLDYYTGPVFEAVLVNAGVGSVMGGGRYDDLVTRFADKRVPATGASIGLDRLITGLERLGKLQRSGSIARVLVVTVPGVDLTESVKLAAELRAAGIPTEVYLGEADAKLSDQLAHANIRNIPIAVVIGPDELEAGTVAVKNLGLGHELRKEIESRDEYREAGRAAQVTVPRADLVAVVLDLIQDGR